MVRYLKKRGGGLYKNSDGNSTFQHEKLFIKAKDDQVRSKAKGVVILSAGLTINLI